MENYEGRGVVVQSLLNDDPRVYGRPVDRALEEFDHADEPVAGVEKEDAENLVAAPRELQAEEPLDILRCAEGAARTVARRQNLQGQGDDGGFLALG